MSQKVHIRTTGQGQVVLPVSITSAIPANARFDPELTDDGILLRFVGIEQAPDPEDLPAWTRNGSA